MTAQNLFTILLETSILAAFAAALSTLVRLPIPKLRLAYWQQVLTILLLVPAGQCALRQSVPLVPSAIFRLSSEAISGTGASASDLFGYLWPVLIGGVAVRVAWLAVGIFRLGCFRTRSRLVQKQPVRNRMAEVRLCTQLNSAVSFGLFRPTILLPESWRSSAPELQRAVLAHERVHLERQDWLLHLMEEAILAAFWFHPAIYFVIAKIRLAREEAVDAEAVARTQDKESYVRALVLNTPGGSRVFAPAFQTEHQLTQRLRALNQEHSMSKRTALFVQAGIGICLLTAAGSAVWAFPLQTAQASGPAKVYRVGNGVTGPVVIYKRDPSYTQEAKQGGVQGKVSLSAEILPDGTAHNIQVVNSLDPGLDAEAMAALRDWTFRPGTKDGVPVTVMATIEFNFSLQP